MFQSCPAVGSWLDEFGVLCRPHDDLGGPCLEDMDTDEGSRESGREVRGRERGREVERGGGGGREK